MFTNTKIALATVLILSAGSAALANDIDVNPSGAQAEREMHGNPLPWWWNSPVERRGSFGDAGNAYGYIATPKQLEGLSQSSKKGHNQ
jgi:hypothetical protein